MGNNRIINVNLSRQELDDILIKNYGYGLLEFSLCFFSIMHGMWSRSKNAKIKIQAHKKERDELYESILDFKIHLAPKCSSSAVKHIEEAIAKRIVILDKLTENSHLKPHKIAKSIKIASLWAQVMKKKERIQWVEICEFMTWFQVRYENTKEGTILTREGNSWKCPRELSRYYSHLKKNYEEGIEELRNIFFPKDRSQIIQLFFGIHQH